MEIYKNGPIELRLGKWQTVLADVAECSAIIADPPYGKRTHNGQRYGRRDANYPESWVTTNGIDYGHLSPADVREFCSSWSPRVSGWFCAMTSHDLVPHYEHALRKAGRYVFKPLPLVMPGMNVRLAGDGPSSWSVDMVVGRPSSGPITKWGTLPGAYVVQPEAGPVRAARGVVGGKPPLLLRAIIRDYTRPGDLVVDPYAGGGTTLLACAIEGRRCIGAEMSPDTFKLAVRRLSAGWTPGLFKETP